MSHDGGATQKSMYRIHGMDCAEEIAVLKREIGPLVGGEQHLSFDLLNSKMIVEGGAKPDAEVIAAVNRTGMRAQVWETDRKTSGESLSVWQKNGRSIMTAMSGASLAAGFSMHAAQHGVWDAFSNESESHGFPVSVVLAYLVAVVSGAWFIIPKALFSLRRLRPDMNLLMTVAVAGAVGIGEYFEAATVAFLFAVALLLESWSVGRARRAIATLMKLAPPTAFCVDNGKVVEKPIEKVAVGSRVLVRPGNRIPLDGVVAKGSSSVNQAPITGESIPVTKEVGDTVYAGSINESSTFEFDTTKAANDTTLARIIQMVEEAQSRRAPSEQWVETFARCYTPAMMVLAFLVIAVPPLLFAQPFQEWFYKGLVLLVIACPCALVISTPVSIVAGLSAAARAGILIKGGIYLEAPSRVRVFAVDKTGTLTKGQPEVQRIVPLNGHSEAELLERAAALESQSEHPLAQAILRRATTGNVPIAHAENFQALKGKGAEGDINGRRFWIGSHRFLHERGREEPGVHDEALRLEDAGHSIVIVGNESHVCGLISVADAVRPEAKDFVSNLKRAGVERIVMLTGDNQGTAKAIANETGVDEVRAELLPEDKVKAIEELVAKHKYVAMVGDGVNDAPALAAASLSIAMGSIGSDAAIETADVALMRDDISLLPWLIRHSRRTLAIIKQNITASVAVKAAFVILTLLGHASLWAAIAADTGVTLLVIANALRLLSGPSQS